MTPHGFGIFIAKSAALTPEEVEEYYKKYYDPSGDASHGRDHIEAVRRNVRELASEQGYRDTGLADAAAVLHDIASGTDREKHELVGAQMAAKDPLLNKKFNARRMKLLVNAIKQHRASTGKPRSGLGRILSDADRLSSLKPESLMSRAYTYGLRHEPEFTEDEQVFRAAEHLKNKYGPGGYGAAASYYPSTKAKLEERMKPVISALAARDLETLRSMTKASRVRSQEEI